MTTGRPEPTTQSASPDTGRVQRDLPSRDRRRARRGLFDRSSPFFGERSPTSDGRSVALDSTENHYVLTGDPRAGGPMRLDASVYRRERYRANLRDNWRTLAEQRQQQRGSRGGLGVNMVVPGGRESAFSTVFGKPEVDLRLNGQADINAGFNYRQSDQQVTVTGNSSQIDPDFKQDLRLGITGTIGDKLQINVDWDTNNQFDYQNQVKLDYTGYDDEIVQSVEAGNVSLETPSQLISGSQRLFGLKSEFQLGNLSLTTVASQQEGQAQTKEIDGGAETSEFDMKPTDYDEDTHYFLGYYFRNNWNRAHQDPTTLRTFDGFGEITDIEVWKLSTSRGSEEANLRKATAVVDLGESPEILDVPDSDSAIGLPRAETDQYDEDDVSALRDGETSAVTYVSTPGNLERELNTQHDVVQDEFKRLERGSDYRLDVRRGFLSLNQRLRPNEALAVAFRYRTRDGDVRSVGDFSSDQGGSSGGINADRLLLKLLRPTNPVSPSRDGSVEPAAWFLEMRNVYRIGGRGFDSENFELDIEYRPPGQSPTTTISEVAGQDPLLQVLGLDRTDQDGARQPDNRFDFNKRTINQEEGLIFFPYLEPFGEHILDVAEENGNRSDGQPYAFTNLYTKKKTNAEEEDKEKNVFHIHGSYKGRTKDFYDLEAFSGLVEGSVEVTAGGQTLEEGTDYVVDYQGGTVTITNQSYLSAGRVIEISYEQNNLVNLQQKTLLGARADWSLRDEFSIGATVMRLSQRSPVDKFRIGEEPVKNTIWGVDGSMDLQPSWLTQVVDALPLVDTRAESQLSVSGEFAQLRPGHTTTEAFDRTVDAVKDAEQDDYAPDERNGVSYIDDFEGFENTFSLREQLSGWQVSAAPDSTADAPGLNEDAPGVSDDRARTHWRGSFGWYRLNENILEELGGSFTRRGNPEATQLLDVRDVFDRDTRGEANPTLRSLDMYFNPWERGAYNYTPDLDAFFQEPTKVWGGVTRRLPEGYTDFSVQNVEFVEFIVKVYPQEGDITDDARLFVDLGTISEDVVPNERLNTEDGLPMTAEGFSELSRIASDSPDGALDIQGDQTEDLGLDGLVSYTEGGYDSALLEQNFYSDFVEQADSLRGALGQLGLTSAQRQRLQAELARIERDPSADDYHYYENDRYFNDETFFPEGVTLQQRFSRYYAGQELNGFEAQNRLAENVSVRQGLSRSPDTEDLDETGGNVNITNNYFQYAVPLDELDERAETDQGPTDYVVSKVGENKDWYKVRIPVRNFTRRVGSIEDFTRIESMRLWTTGHEAPVTMRFASMELVGSQWRTSEPVTQQPVENGSILEPGEGELRVASINDEEDSEYEAPVGAIVSRNRTARGVQQRSREQSLLLNVDRLEAGQQRGIFKSFNQGLDLLKYSNLRMYTHVHGSSNSQQEKEKIRENLRLFVRIGASETGDYYEYEQPLTPSNVPGTADAQSPWLEENEMNLVLSALNQLKTARDQSGERTDTTFSSTNPEVDLSLDFAPSGTVLKIRGTPSLRDVNTVVIGVRHAGDPDASPQPPELQNIELWVNELRVSGFDERKGWAANSRANISLADLAEVQGSFQRRTDGFGGLSSTLNEREQSNNTSWNLRTDFYLDALLPEQQGWSMPVTMQVQSSHNVPRFDPSRGDVQVEEVAEQFEALTDSTIQDNFADRYPGRSADEIRRRLRDSVRTAAESYNLRRTMTAGVSKQGSDSWLLRQTMDATSLNFSYLDRQEHTPQYRVNNQWSWSGNFEYRLDFGGARTVHPLGFLPDVPVLGSLSDVAFNYVPRSLSFTSSAEREVTTRRDRPTGRGMEEMPDRIAYPYREQQNFTHRRSFGLQYDPFQFLNLSFDTNTRQKFNDVAERSQTNLLIRDEPGVRDTTLSNVDPNAFFNNPSAYLGELPPGADITTEDQGRTIFAEERLRQRSETDVFRDLIFGGASPRTDRYNQRFQATLRLGITDRQALNWIDLQDITYNSSFQWQNGSKGSLTGATVNNSFGLQTGVSLHPNRVWERFGFFNRLKEAQRQADRDDEEGQPPPEAEGTDEEGEEDADAEEDDEPSWDDLPLPDPVGVLRRIALTVLDINDLTISYNGDRSSQASNVGTLTDDGEDVNVDYSLLDAARGQGPSLGYRFGLDRSVDPETKRVLREELQVSDALRDQHRFEGRTSLSPSQALQVDLNWNVEWSRQSTIDYQREASRGGGSFDGPIRQFESESGDNRASVWAFGSYGSVFEAQRERLQRSVETSSGTVLDAEDVPLAKASVASDFRDGFLMGSSSLGSNGFVPFPLPGWNVRYSGLSDWPLLNRIVQSASLSHSYNAEYQSRFRSVEAAGEETSLGIDGRTLRYRRPDFEVGSSQISEQFQPLLGLEITWPGDLQTSVEWNRRTTTYLRTASLKVEENMTSEVSGRISYSQRGLRIPVLGLGRLENRIQFSLDLTRSVRNERSFNLREALENAETAEQARQGNNVSVLSETSRLEVTPTLTYRLSNRVTADFQLQYEKFNGDSRQPSYTNINGGFNVRVSISEN